MFSSCLPATYSKHFVMKKLYLAAVLVVVFAKISQAQTVIPELINFTQLANLEKAHPELFVRCATCKEKENDARSNNRNLFMTMESKFILCLRNTIDAKIMTIYKFSSQ